MIKTIFFDFDGVILDSMSIREKGFRHIFSKYQPKHVEKLVDYHRLNGGISRFEKIHYFFEYIVKEKITDQEVDEYAEKFSLIMKKYLIDPNKIILDTFQFIKQNHKKYDLHIVSGSEENELCWICSNLELDQYFITINGSPTLKSKLVAKLINDWNYSVDECVLIGDSINDYDAAKDNGIIFFGYNNPSLINVVYGYIENFNDFKLID